MSDHRKEICRIISEMLDNPDEIGIYPTTRCYDRLEQYIEAQLAEAQDEIATLKRTYNQLFDETQKLQSDVTNYMEIANEHVNEEERLRKAIADAPHALFCLVSINIRGGYDWDESMCDCWKSEVLSDG